MTRKQAVSFTTSCPRQTIWAHVAEAAWGAVSAYLTRRALAAASRELRCLDDRMLKDIGLHRSEIESILMDGVSGRLDRVRSPFSIAPKSNRLAHAWPWPT